MKPAPVLFSLSKNVFNPPDGFFITDFTQIPLSGSEIGMPEDYFADNFYRGSRAAGISGRMPPEIVGSDIKTDLPASFFNDLSCAGITDGENSLMGFNLLYTDILSQSVCNLFGDESKFILAPAFGI